MDYGPWCSERPRRTENKSTTDWLATSDHVRLRTGAPAGALDSLVASQIRDSYIALHTDRIASVIGILIQHLLIAHTAHTSLLIETLRESYDASIESSGRGPHISSDFTESHTSSRTATPPTGFMTGLTSHIYIDRESATESAIDRESPRKKTGRPRRLGRSGMHRLRPGRDTRPGTRTSVQDVQSVPRCSRAVPGRSVPGRIGASRNGKPTTRKIVPGRESSL
jgi:hypothetical protein